MKIAIAFPPLNAGKGVPLLAQNRQFQWFHSPCYIYPIIPAMAATLLKKAGHEVFWLDGIAEKWSIQKWLEEVKKAKPDLIVIETKTPVVKRHWKIIKDLKSLTINHQPLTIVLVGDHVTALPLESLENSPVDYILTGGDFDFLLLNLANHLSKGEKLEPGIWYRKGSKIENTGKFELKHNLDSLPMIDRDLTKWQLYAYDNGNYKKTPGTYTMVGRDCWWARCTFCSWTTTFPRFRTRSPESLLDEIGILIDKYKVKEVMDDTGTFPVGSWLEKFCHGMIERGYNRKIYFDCNMRFGILNQEMYILMKKAGFRFILYGLESSNQKTLDRVKKGIKIDDIINGCRMAKKAGLMPHLTVMVGYPWETKKEAEQTLNLAKDIFEKGWADSLQATVVIPYPGTPLFEECKANNWLLSQDWDKFDMSQPVMKTSMKPEEVMALSRSLYRLAFRPKFLIRQLLSVRSFDDVGYLVRTGFKVIGHLLDFGRKAKEAF